MGSKTKQKPEFPILLIASVPAGVLAGVFFMNIVQSFSPWKPAAGVDYTSGKPMADWVGSLSDQAHAFYLFSFLLGSFLGGILTNYLAKSSVYKPAILTGCCIMFYAVVSYLVFPNPMWMSLLGCAGCVVMAWLGGLLVKKEQNLMK